jgi:hypothetical protein
MDNPDAHSLSPEPELFLSIRFSASIPDVLLEIASPKTTTTAGLKRLIRSRLPEELSNHRLRLIHAGKALEDSTPLSTSLKLPSFYGESSSGSSPPYGTAAGPSQSPEDDDGGDILLDKKGKTPIRTEPRPRIYIHCSIGDVTLSASELAAEEAIASTTTSTTKSRNTSSTDTQQQQQHDHTNTITTTPTPRGFDRLLSAGFTVSEVSALRARFLDIQSLTRTPDMMPSGAELRALEERWMDDSPSGVGPDGQPEGGAGGVGGGGDDGGSGSPLDDMLWGCVMGFFWPVGCSVWLLREEGVWSWRKGLAVFMGVVINLVLGTSRMMS